MRIQLLFLLFILSLTTVHCPLFAAEKTTGTLTIRPWTFQRIEKVEQLIKKSDYGKVIKLLDKVRPQVTDVPYEEAIVLRTYAQVYALKGDYKRAASYLKDALAMGAFPAREDTEGYFNLAQLYMGNKQYKAAITEFRKLQADGVLKPNGLMMLGTAHVQLKQYQKALKPVKKAVAQMSKPKEAWYQLLFGIHYELKQYKSSVAILHKLVRYWPEKKTYWMQLASIEQLRKRYRQTLSVQELAYQKGFLNTQSELLALVYLYFQENVPHHAARILTEGMNSKKIASTEKNWQLLSNAWAQAREYDQAITALKEMAKLTKKGEADMQLAQLFTEKEHWKQVAIHARQAIKKGKIDVGQAWLYIGISALETKNIDAARQAFVKAKNYQSAQKSAAQWLVYLDSINTEKNI